MISINGNVVHGNIAGGSIIVSGNRIVVNGKDVTPEDVKEISIVVTGDVGELSVDACEKLKINGNVTGSVKTLSGDVRCGDIGGSVQTMSGDVKADKIGGPVSTMSGNIRG